MNPFLQCSAEELSKRDVFGEVPDATAPIDLPPCRVIPITPQVRALDEARSRPAPLQWPPAPATIAPEPVSAPAEDISDEEHELDGAWQSLTLDDKRFVLADALRRSR